MLLTDDNNSNITTTTDARNLTITATYDALNRIIVRDYSDSAMPDVNFYYDGTGIGGVPANSKGKTTRVSSSVSESRYTSFDDMGRVLASEQRTTAEQLAGTQTPYGFQYTYNLSGALIEETYPSGRVVKNTVDSNGMLEQVQSRKNSTAGFWTYADSFRYNAAGAVTKMQLGNGHWETATYNERQQVTQIGLGTLDTGQDLLKLDFSYAGPNPSSTPDKNNGSLRKQTITVPSVSGTPGFTAVQVYDYDGLNRIHSATETISGNQSWKQTFQYDRFGNRTFDAANTTTLGSCPTAVCNPTISSTTNRISSSGYTFDSDGSMTQDAAGKRFGYDTESRQKAFFATDNQTSTPTVNYFYDGEGKRVKTTTPGGGATIFVYDAAGELSAEYSVVDTGQIETPQAPRVSYLTTDHLGSTRVVTEASGAVVSRKDFAAFGDETLTSQRTPSLGYNILDVRQDYTGYLKDNESGLEYAQARYYNTQHGRFTSADPMTASARIRNPQTFNRYSYALNSPYKFTDPLGLIAVRSAGLKCAIGALNCNGVSDPLLSGGGDGDDDDDGPPIRVEAPYDPATSVPGCGTKTSGECAQYAGQTPSAGFVGPPPVIAPGAPAPVVAPAPGAAPGLGRLVLGGVGRAVVGSLVAPGAAILILSGTVQAPAPLSSGTSKTTTTTKDEDSDPLQNIFRVYGGASPLYGPSWTPVDPRTVPNYRGAAGLPNSNTGENLAEGQIPQSKIRAIIPARSADGNRGGLPEYVVNPRDVIVRNIVKLSPRF